MYFFEIIPTEAGGFAAIVDHFKTQDDAEVFCKNVYDAMKTMDWLEKEQKIVDAIPQDHDVFEYTEYPLGKTTNDKLEELAKLKNMEPIDVLEMMIENEMADHVGPAFEEREKQLVTAQ